MKKSIIILFVFLLSFLKLFAQTSDSSNTNKIIIRPNDLWVPTDSLPKKKLHKRKVHTNASLLPPYYEMSPNDDEFVNYYQINIAGIDHGEIAKNAILNSKRLSLDSKDSCIFKISSFKITLVPNGGGEIKEFKNNKNGKLTKAMLAAIKRAPTGSKIYFEYITGVDKYKQANSFHLTNFILK